MMVHDIARVYDEVLRRPRFQFHTREEENQQESVRFTIFANNEKFDARFYDGRRGVDVRVYALDGTVVVGLFYAAYFSKQYTHKVRKAALILAKKLTVKPVHDIMEK